MSLPAKSRIKIGLLGGSFNPAHAGHLHISVEAIKKLGLDQVWWLVSPQNPLKPKEEMRPFDERVKNALRIANGNARIKVTDIEKNFPTNYTRDNIMNIKELFPDNDFVWLMGADNFAQIPLWYKWQDIFHLIPIAIFDRSPFTYKALAGKAAKIFAKNRVDMRRARTLVDSKTPAWCFLHIKKNPLSSTLIRNKKNEK